MRYVNPNENPNALVGILLLLLLAIFAGPDLLPQLVSEVVPFADEGVPCSRLRTGTDRAYHQSVLGRSASQGNVSPFSLSVDTSSVPASAPGQFTVSVTIRNNTLGTVPILLQPGSLNTEVPVTGNGLGVAAGETPVEEPAAVSPAQGGPYPEQNIRLLGPRQRCVHRVVYDFQQIPPQFSVPGTPVRAFYRNNNPGAITIPEGETREPVFPDQGLWVGLVESEPDAIPASTQ